MGLKGLKRLKWSKECNLRSKGVYGVLKGVKVLKGLRVLKAVTGP